MNIPEKKYFDTNITSFTPAVTTWRFDSLLTGIAQGNTATTRIGQKIFVHKIEIMVYCEPVSTGFVYPNTVSQCRIMCWHDKEAVGAVPTAAAFFQADNWTALQNTAQNMRYRILNDFAHSMVVTGVNNPVGATALATGPPMMRKYTLYPKKQIVFSDTGSTITSILKDDWGIAFCVSIASSCAFKYNYKVTFSDM